MRPCLYVPVYLICLLIHCCFLKHPHILLESQTWVSTIRLNLFFSQQAQTTHWTNCINSIPPFSFKCLINPFFPPKHLLLTLFFLGSCSSTYFSCPKYCFSMVSSHCKQCYVSNMQTKLVYTYSLNLPKHLLTLWSSSNCLKWPVWCYRIRFV